MSLHEIEKRLDRLERAVRLLDNVTMVILRVLRFEEKQIHDIQNQLKPKTYPRPTGIKVSGAK